MFWLVISGLLIVALALVLWPLLRAREADTGLESAQLNIALAKQGLRELNSELAQGQINAEQFAEAEAELQTQLLEDVEAATTMAEPQPRALSTALWLMGLLPLLALVVYWQLGKPQLIQGVPEQQVAANEQLDIATMLTRLETRLQEQPDDAVGWLMLGRSYNYLQRFDEALLALKKAYDLAPDNPDVLIAYATILGHQQQGRLAGEPEQLLDRALALAPQHPQALFLRGHAYYQQGDTAQALAIWQSLLESLPEDSEDRAQVEATIAQANGAAPSGEAAANSGAAIRVHVALADQLRDQVPAEAMVFIMARPVDGSRMPVAVSKHQVGDLPLDIVLDDSLAMNPARRLSNFSSVILEARVALSGNPLPQSGDLSGQLDAVAVSTPEVLQLTIDRVLP